MRENRDIMLINMQSTQVEGRRVQIWGGWYEADKINSGSTGNNNLKVVNVSGTTLRQRANKRP